MKKWLKKVTIIALTTATVLTIGVPAFANDNSEPTLDTIAANNITVESTVDETGNVLTIYNNLDTFISKVKEQHNEISNLELAKYILDYTNQEYEGLPESELLRTLNYKNICITTQEISLPENLTEVTPRDSISETIKNTMKITTGFALTKTVGSENYYDVWANADWLDYPIARYADAFTIGHNVTYDDNVAPYGYLFQTFKCNYCNKTSSNNAYVALNDELDDSLELKYGAAPSLHINAKQAICNSCVIPASDTKFSTMLRYGVIAPNGMGNIQASYGHGTVSIGDIAVSFANHKPIFSATPIGSVTTYEASTRTLR